MNNVEIGTGLEGFMVKPAGIGPLPGVVVLMEAYGLTGHIQNACRRLADAGFLALAPDLFHGELIPYNEVQAAMAKIGTLKDEVMLAEIDASLDWFDRQTDVRGDARGIMGFCMGGRLAFLAGCRSGSRLQAVVSFYGGGIAPDGPDRFGRTPPIVSAGTLEASLFLGYGADDGGIPPSEHARIVSTLSAAKKRYTLAIYPGAGHAFLCEERSNHAPAAAAVAWEESLGFLALRFSAGG